MLGLMAEGLMGSGGQTVPTSVMVLILKAAETLSVPLEKTPPHLSC